MNKSKWIIDNELVLCNLSSISTNIKLHINEIRSRKN